MEESKVDRLLKAKLEVRIPLNRLQLQGLSTHPALHPLDQETILVADVSVIVRKARGVTEHSDRESIQGGEVSWPR